MTAPVIIYQTKVQQVVTVYLLTTTTHGLLAWTNKVELIRFLCTSSFTVDISAVTTTIPTIISTPSVLRKLFT